LLAAVEQIAPIHQGGQMGGVQLVGRAVVLERLLLVAHLLRRLGQAVIQDVELAVSATIRLARQHL